MHVCVCVCVCACICVCDSQLCVTLSVNITLTLVYQRPLTPEYKYSAVILDYHVTCMHS